MQRSRFSEEQTIGILKKHQTALGAKELCRKHGVSDVPDPDKGPQRALVKMTATLD